MKDKKLIVLYILMLIVGFALLFTNSSSDSEGQGEVEKVIVVEDKLQEQEKTEYVTVAVANIDIDKSTILTTSDYSFKTLEIKSGSFNKYKYVADASQIDAYVAKNNIQQGTIIEHNFLASPASPEYMALSLKDGVYLYPFPIENADSYLIKNLKSGDLIDIYVLYGAEGNNYNHLVSPSQNFITSNIKPIIVGKKILFIESETISVNNNQTVDKINLALSNEEIKLVRTLMTNATIMLYPSTQSKNIDDGMYILNDTEKGWPVSEQRIFNQAKINKLRGN